MENAKKEFLEHVGNKEIACAFVQIDGPRECLPLNFTLEQFDIFLMTINKGYDSGYGGQQLDGVIWYRDGTWSERAEYDGAEWWEYKRMPDIPRWLL